MEGKELTDLKKQTILEAAAKLFYEQGYDHTTTRELAKAVNMSNAGLYWHFKDKEEILFHILDRSVTNFIEVISETIIPGEDPQINLENIIRTAVRAALKDGMALGLMVKEQHRLNKDQNNIINKKKRATFELVKQKLLKIKQKEKSNSTDINISTFSLIAMIFWPFTWFNANGPLDVEGLASEISTLFFKGFLGK